MGANARRRREPPPRPDWADVAYRLWWRKRWTFVEISGFLAAEGWDARPGAVQAVVLEMAGQNLSGLVGRPARHAR